MIIELGSTSMEFIDNCLYVFHEGSIGHSMETIEQNTIKALGISPFENFKMMDELGMPSHRYTAMFSLIQEG